MICDTCNWRSAVEGEHCALGIQPDTEDSCRKHTTPEQAAEEAEACAEAQQVIKCKNY